MKSYLKILFTYAAIGTILLSAIVILERFGQLRHPALPVFTAYILTVLCGSLHYASLHKSTRLLSLSMFNYVLLQLMSLLVLAGSLVFGAVSFGNVLYSLMMLSLVYIPSALAFALAVRIIFFRKIALHS